ncbi:hypothetical protein BK120_30185 [Paenibacillus sp. FSL A5-0031]|uniref:colicin E3/pyocin S6 family cytotoxin n=1 Tax=Paenibacillus sp. FSL A5-0031 TaxID=1920420 RepID=UPI00096C6116|nr:colicin E3/pyocin S6 family cytotoxin [Paenibacillus sp. FSL A5-0031]OME75935.1 hypothetical protein BK120_30185 [Paenibacillus sp. FSL A5-0031]
MEKSERNWREVPFKDYPVVEFLALHRTNHRWKKEWIHTDKKKRRYYHKDPLHGEVEVYDKNGYHIGVLTPQGDHHPTKGKVEGRTINI